MSSTKPKRVISSPKKRSHPDHGDQLPSDPIAPDDEQEQLITQAEENDPKRAKVDAKVAWPTQAIAISDLSELIPNQTFVETKKFHYVGQPKAGAENTVTASYVFANTNANLWNIRLWEPNPEKNITSWGVTTNMEISQEEFDILEHEFMPTLKRYIYDNAAKFFAGKILTKIQRAVSFEAACSQVIDDALQVCWREGGVSDKTGNPYGPTIKLQLPLDKEPPIGTGYPLLDIYDSNGASLYHFPQPLSESDAANPKEREKYERVVASHMKDYPSRIKVLDMLGKHCFSNVQWVILGLIKVMGKICCTARAKVIQKLPWTGGKPDIEKAPICPFGVATKPDPIEDYQPTQAVAPMDYSHFDD